MIKVGEMNQFVVLRKSDLGYMLANKDEQILMHFHQAMNQELEENSIVECFVQYDSKGRMVATLEKPTVTVSKPGWGTVVEVNARMGIFVNIGTFKDILISKDDLPQNVKIWPNEGDMVYIRIFLHRDHLNGAILTKNEILELNHQLKKASLGDKLEAYVVRSTENAVNALTQDGSYIYISHKQFRENYRIGQKVEVMVIGFHDDELVGSLNKVKEEMVADDEKTLLDYLTKNGKMPYTAKTEASIIEKEFHMSRKAFKRALGSLYKNRKVYFEDDITYLNKN